MAGFAIRCLLNSHSIRSLAVGLFEALLDMDLDIRGYIAQLGYVSNSSEK